MATRRQRSSETASSVKGETDHAENNGNGAANEELTTKVNDLKNALEQAQQKEKSLQQFVESLQKQLAEEKAIVQNLQASAEEEKLLQQTVDQLQAQLDEERAIVQNLQAIAKREKQLQETVDRLQTQLDEEKATVHNLQASVEKTNKLQTELEQVQKTALKLAEENKKLIEESNARKQTKQSSQLGIAKPPSDLRSHDEVLRQRQAAALNHPIFPNNPASTQFTDQDIGWVD